MKPVLSAPIKKEFKEDISPVKKPQSEEKKKDNPLAALFGGMGVAPTVPEEKKDEPEKKEEPQQIEAPSPSKQLKKSKTQSFGLFAGLFGGGSNTANATSENSKGETDLNVSSDAFSENMLRDQILE